MTSLFGPSGSGGGGVKTVAQANSVQEQFFEIQGGGVGFLLTFADPFVVPAGYNSVLVEASGRWTIFNNSGNDQSFAGQFQMIVPDFPPFGLYGVAVSENQVIPNGETGPQRTFDVAKVFSVQAAQELTAQLYLGIAGSPDDPTTSDNQTQALLSIKLTYFNS